jgi:major membrane immunogen (membrane-anchored lipoprotein)
MLIKQIITERYVNLIHDNERKDLYKYAVYDLLQKSYANIGGVKGSGLEDPDSMKSIPFWKIAVKDGKVIAVVLYKDKNGRKAVATGNDGSLAGKRAILDIIRKEKDRSYAEKLMARCYLK